MILFVTLAAFGAIAAFELPFLWQKKRWKELTTTGVVWLLALVYSCLQILHLPVPDVNAPIKAIFGKK